MMMATIKTVICTISSSKYLADSDLPRIPLYSHPGICPTCQPLG
jgi:hypothetical protein